MGECKLVCTSRHVCPIVLVQSVMTLTLSATSTQGVTGARRHLQRLHLYIRLGMQTFKLINRRIPKLGCSGEWSAWAACCDCCVTGLLPSCRPCLACVFCVESPWMWNAAMRVVWNVGVSVLDIDETEYWGGELALQSWCSLCGRLPTFVCIFGSVHLIWECFSSKSNKIVNNCICVCLFTGLSLFDSRVIWCSGCYRKKTHLNNTSVVPCKEGTTQATDFNPHSKRQEDKPLFYGLL
jgi:hypothetical protein